MASSRLMQLVLLAVVAASLAMHAAAAPTIKQVSVMDEIIGFSNPVGIVTVTDDAVAAAPSVVVALGPDDSASNSNILLMQYTWTDGAWEDGNEVAQIDTGGSAADVENSVLLAGNFDASAGTDMLLLSSVITDRTIIFSGTGSGGFEAPAAYHGHTTLLVGESACAGNLDDTEVDEVVLMNGDDLTVLSGATEVVVDTLPGFVSNIALLDWNADDLLDIVVVFGSKINVYVNDGSLSFSDGVTDAPDLGYVMRGSVVAIDWDGNAKPDLTGGAFVALNQQPSPWTDQEVLYGYTSRRAVAADVDGDGGDEALFGNQIHYYDHKGGVFLLERGDSDTGQYGNTLNAVVAIRTGGILDVVSLVHKEKSLFRLIHSQPGNNDLLVLLIIIAAVLGAVCLAAFLYSKLRTSSSMLQGKV